MNKQEIVREGIAHWIQDEADNGYLRHWEEFAGILTLDQQWDYFLKISDLILADEHRKGVVIKGDFTEEGYFAWLPLIKEE